MPVSIEQHVEWISDCIDHMRRNKFTTIEAAPQAEEQWTAHVAAIVNTTLIPAADSWYMGANIAGKPRTFLPYLDPTGVGGYRQRCGTRCTSTAGGAGPPVSSSAPRMASTLSLV